VVDDAEVGSAIVRYRAEVSALENLSNEMLNCLLGSLASSRGHKQLVFRKLLVPEWTTNTCNGLNGTLIRVIRTKAGWAI